MRAVAIDNVGWLMWDMIIESLSARIKNGVSIFVKSLDITYKKSNIDISMC